MEAQSKAVNLAIQYGAMAIGQSVVGSKFVDPTGPGKLSLISSLKNSLVLSHPKFSRKLVDFLMKMKDKRIQKSDRIYHPSFKQF